jgi:hypothetical protein
MGGRRQEEIQKRTLPEALDLMIRPQNSVERSAIQKAVKEYTNVRKWCWKLSGV